MILICGPGSSHVPLTSGCNKGLKCTITNAVLTSHTDTLTVCPPVATFLHSYIHQSVARQNRDSFQGWTGKLTCSWGLTSAVQALLPYILSALCCLTPLGILLTGLCFFLFSKSFTEKERNTPELTKGDT